MESKKRITFRKLLIINGIMALLVIYTTFCFLRDGINAHYFENSTQKQKIMLNADYFETSTKKQKIIHCPEEYNMVEEINSKEFFIFNSNIVWCNVFKSASTSILNMIGLLEGFSNQDLKRMHTTAVPLIQSFRNIYGRPSIEELEDKMAEPETKTFLVKRDPFKRLLSGYRNKIIYESIKHKGGKYYQIAITILSTYRGKGNYNLGETLPSFTEFVTYILDTYDTSGKFDMHWAPVVDFCSVCQVNFTHIIDFENFYDDMVEMLPEKKQVLETFKSKKLNSNNIGPITNSDIIEEFEKLPPDLYQRLCQFYEKDFKVFGYFNKRCEEVMK